MLVAALGMMAEFFTSGAGANRTPMFMFFPVMMVMSVLGSVLYGARGGANRSAEIDGNRRSYLRYLDCLDDDIAATTTDQRRSQHSRHPAPESLWALVGSPRMVERDPDDEDFCSVRVGIGDQALCTTLLEPDLGPAENQDPVTVSAVRALIRQRSVIGRMPIALPLREYPVVAVDGEEQYARGLVRAMVCQLAAQHGPHVIAIAVVTDHRTREEWEWLKWLPRSRTLTGSPRSPDAAVPRGDRRRCACSRRGTARRAGWHLRCQGRRRRVAQARYVCASTPTV